MRFSVMKALVENPAFSAPAKEALLRQIHRLDFENYKRDILAAINKVATEPASPEMKRAEPVAK